MKENKKGVTSADIARLLVPVSNIREESESANSHIIRLSLLVRKGSSEAALEFFRTVAFGTDILESLCKEKPELFRPIARDEFAWPVMYSPHPEKKKETAEFLRELGLAKATQINLSSGKTFSWKVPANVVAFDLYQLAQTLRRGRIAFWTLDVLSALMACQIACLSDGLPVLPSAERKKLEEMENWGLRGAGKNLPTLSKKTASQWATAAQELFRIIYGEKFEDHVKLKRLRRAVGSSTKDARGKVGGRAMVRKMMRKALTQSWHSIAALD